MVLILDKTIVHTLSKVPKLNFKSNPLEQPQYIELSIKINEHQNK